MGYRMAIAKWLVCVLRWKQKSIYVNQIIRLFTVIHFCNEFYKIIFLKNIFIFLGTTRPAGVLFLVNFHVCSLQIYEKKESATFPSFPENYHVCSLQIYETKILHSSSFHKNVSNI